MPLYQFNIYDGQDRAQAEGLELIDLSEAKIIAVQYAGALIKDHADEFWRDGEWAMEVVDPSGLVLFRLTFFATVAATLYHA